MQLTNESNVPCTCALSCTGAYVWENVQALIASGHIISCFCFCNCNLNSHMASNKQANNRQRKDFMRPANVSGKQVEVVDLPYSMN